MQITIEANVSPAQAQLAGINERINTQMRTAMVESNSLLHVRVRDYPPPPPQIQGPANVPVRTFTTRGGQTVRVRATKSAGRGITLQKARDLRYKRTNTLYRSWQTVLSGEGNELVGGVVSSGQIAPYNRYVQDAAYQATIHQGRWEPVQDIARRSETEVQDIFTARINSVIGG